MNVFIRTRFDDSVFCVIRKYHLNQSMQCNRGIESKCKYIMLNASIRIRHQRFFEDIDYYPINCSLNFTCNSFGNACFI